MNSKAMVYASFAADALALGGHWVYNAAVIEKNYGRLDRYEKPLGHAYHPTKNKGQFTHYGDQMLLLLEDIVHASGFDAEHFADAWQKFFKSYDGYVDHATKTTLDNFRNGKNYTDSGSESTDLSGAARICPLVYYCHTAKIDFLQAVHAQTAMTHNHPDVIDSAIFFADITLRVLSGRSPTLAIDEAIDANDSQRVIAQWIRKGKESIGRDTREMIAAFGQQCAVEAAFPGVIHLIYKYENDLKTALIENVMAGGDSAARGMAVGMVLGAHNGLSAIPDHWLSEMAAFGDISRFLEEIDQLAT